MTAPVACAWRDPLDSEEIDRLHASAFGGSRSNRDWRGQLERHSLGWVTVRNGGTLIGFVNVAWDGGG